MSEPTHREPVFNVPLAVIGLIGVLVAVHVGRQFLSEAVDRDVVLALAAIPARFSVGGDALPGGPYAAWTTLLTHGLLHGDFTHLGINSAWLLAFGSILARRSGGLRFLLLMAAGTIAGAAAFTVANPHLVQPLVGASGGVSALMGGVFRFLFRAHDVGLWRLGEAPQTIPRMSLREALTNRRAVIACSVWIGLNLLFATGLAEIFTDGTIAWEAHLGGFLLGFLFFGLFDSPESSPEN